MDKKEDFKESFKEDFMKSIKDVEMKPNWIRHVDAKFNILHILRSNKDLYILLDNIEQYYRDMLITPPEPMNGKQSDDGKEFDENHYNRYSREFTSWHIKHAGGIISKVKCTSVLDVGCGVGNIVKGFMKNKVDVRGIDISNYAIDNCSKEIHKLVSCADIRKIDTLPKTKFDLVTCYNVLEHVSDPDVVIYNISNLASKWIHITVRDIRCLYPEDIQMFDPTLITGRSIKWWIEEFEKEGFDLVFDLDYTWLIFEPRFALMVTGCPVFQALFRKREEKEIV